MESGVYCIENVETGKRYIGKGIDVIKEMKRCHKGCTYIYNALQKHGKEAFCRYPVEYCEPEKLAEREQYYIKEWDTKVPHGYNLTDGGEGNPGWIPSPETIERMIVARQYTSPETRKKMSDSAKGRRASPETIEKMRKNNKGENNPNWGNHPSPEGREKMRSVNIGRYPSLETRKKKSLAVTGENNPRFGTKLISAPSMFYGVSKKILRAGRIRWTSQMGGKKLRHWIGAFDVEINAARAYDKYVIENNLPNPLNFPDGIHPYWEIN